MRWWWGRRTRRSSPRSSSSSSSAASRGRSPTPAVTAVPGGCWPGGWPATSAPAGRWWAGGPTGRRPAEAAALAPAAVPDPRRDRHRGGGDPHRRPQPRPVRPLGRRLPGLVGARHPRPVDALLPPPGAALAAAAARRRSAPPPEPDPAPQPRRAGDRPAPARRAHPRGARQRGQRRRVRHRGRHHHVIIAAAVPGALEHRAAAGGIIAALVGTVLVLLILTVGSLFRAVIGVVRRIPLARRIVPQVLELQRDTVALLRRWDTWAWSVLSVAGALVAITLFWLVVSSLKPGFVSWQDAAFVYAVSHVVGAISLSPGGLGGFEASAAGLLILVGLGPGTAAAAALVQRGADKGVATIAGLGAFMVARRRTCSAAPRPPGRRRSGPGRAGPSVAPAGAGGGARRGRRGRRARRRGSSGGRRRG
ncbi:MAG: flippase-like domain-containing protein [Chloroflexi bacterium]|nr:MAG: flippase-like domain-containing protein [Chloroflexota bacterium]